MTLGLTRLFRWCAGPLLLAGAGWHFAGPAAVPAPAASGVRQVPRGHWFDSRNDEGVLAAAPDASIPLGAQIDRLTSTKDPADAFRAYSLVNNCTRFAATGTLRVYDADSPRRWRQVDAQERRELGRLCDGMTERIKQDSYAQLEIATRAGVQGADTAFLRAGPFGDPGALRSRPNDPLVQAWKKQAIAQLAARAAQGDHGSITTLLAEYLKGDVAPRDPVASLPYAIADKLLFEELSRRAKDTIPAAFDDAYVRAVEQSMTPQQIAAAELSGKKMFAMMSKDWAPRPSP
jgi:hypothetical protein